MAQGATDIESKTEFLNTTDGHLGVVLFNHKNERDAIALAPGDTVWLSEEEQRMTANAPRDPQNNPFLIRPFVKHDNMSGEIVEEGERASLEEVDEARPTSAGRPISKDRAHAEPPAPEGEF